MVDGGINMSVISSKITALDNHIKTNREKHNKMRGK